MIEQEVSLQELFYDVWRAKFYIFLTIVCFLIVAFFFTNSITPKYTATMIVAPADGYALGDYASKIQYDRIAALPFWRPKDQEGASTDFYRFIYTLRGFSASVILMKDTNFIKGINKNIKNDIQNPQELAAYLDKNLRIDPLGATPLRKVSYHHSDPEFAAALLRKVHLVSDQMIRRDRRRQAQSRIAYLENALNKTKNPDHRKGITNLLMQQEHVKMLANLDEAYAAIVVEPASYSPKPTWPNKTLVFFLASILGFVIGLFAWNLVRHKGEKFDKS